MAQFSSDSDYSILPICTQNSYLQILCISNLSPGGIFCTIKAATTSVLLAAIISNPSSFKLDSKVVASHARASQLTLLQARMDASPQLKCLGSSYNSDQKHTYVRVCVCLSALHIYLRAQSLRSLILRLLGTLVQSGLVRFCFANLRNDPRSRINIPLVMGTHDRTSAITPSNKNECHPIVGWVEGQNLL